MNDLQISSASDLPDDGAHLDDFRAADIGEDVGAADDVRPLGPDGEEPEGEKKEVQALMDRDTFFGLFQGGFAAPAMVMPELEPLAIQPHEMPAGRKASDSLYNLLERYYPAALGEKTGPVWDAITLGTFLYFKAMIMRMILEEKRKPPPKDVTPKDATDDKGDEEAAPAFKSGRGKSPVDWMNAEQPA